MNDPTAQIGVQLGQNAFKAGQEYFEHNVRTHPLPARIFGDGSLGDDTQI